ncbi:MAG: DNA primase [Firmicutes bacterium]|nr:DNA primase [Bacillota bacterium]
METVIIVEGKNDRERLLPHLHPDTHVLCTFGIPRHDRLLEIVKQAQDANFVYIFTDNDRVGRRIRRMLSDEFPDAIHLHTKSEYGGVEKTPSEYLAQILEKHELLSDM